MNTRTITRPRLGAGLAVATLLTAAVAAVAPGISDAAAPSAHPAAAAAATKTTWEPRWHSEFGGNAPAKWKGVPDTSRTAWSTANRIMVSQAKKSQAHYLARNVDQRSGNLVITTERHCVKKSATHTNFDLYTNATASVAPCGAGKKAVYSSGRLDMLDAGKQLSGNFKVEFRASMPDQPAVGTRQALWMHNTDQYCDSVDALTNLGEFDALEWYGDRPGRTTATTHMSCKGNGDWKTIRRQHAGPMSNADNTFHVWSVEKVGKRVKYFMDGKQLDGKDVCGAGKFTLTAPVSCAQVMGLPYFLIMNGEVFKDGNNGTGHRSPLDGRRFPKQQLQVDWVRTYTG
ncbi:Glycosyl hydrolases family 16 [Pedococcus dokdonensis]|uniref:Glycosyl hydrolases family 16 n=1 Tax=Pedococcus dokdonensis TaxID=443156 RepID=A0A1H0UJW0_9MICO|nr:family 16 glycosylhydrolase [Pedococcus dokdonensis]SDP66258.1 Glycosyl hydrolases family 16 [Pedococcus dokdonensis]